MEIFFYAAALLLGGVFYIVIGTLLARVADRLMNGSWKSGVNDDGMETWIVLAWPVFIPFIFSVIAGLFVYEKINELFEAK